jgi:hypothetical protein
MCGIVGTKTKQPKTVNYNSFDLMPNEELLLGGMLEKYMNQIKQKEYKAKSKFEFLYVDGLITKVEPLPISTLHRLTHIEETESMHRCACKSLCVSSKCKCRKYKTQCGPRCGCKGNCQHSQDMKKSSV